MTTATFLKSASRIVLAAFTALSPLAGATIADARPGGGGGGFRAPSVSARVMAPSAPRTLSTGAKVFSAPAAAPVASAVVRPPADARVLSRSYETRHAHARAYEGSNPVGEVLDAIQREQRRARIREYFRDRSAAPSTASVAAYRAQQVEPNYFTASIDSFLLQQCFTENVGKPFSFCFDQTRLSQNLSLDPDKVADLLKPIPADKEGQIAVSARLGYDLGPVPAL